MIEQISEAIKEAMRSKNKEKLDVLRMLKAKLIENNTAVEKATEQDVIIQYYKKLEDSLQLYPTGPQSSKIKQELEILKEYMPQPLSTQQVQTLIAELLSASPAANMGQIMKLLSPQIRGRFNGQEASNLVKEAISKK